jgi:DNA-binding CsgD family transcriptional regulator
MMSASIGRLFGGSVAAIAVLHTLSAVWMPVVSRRLGTLTIAMLMIVLLLHAALFWWGSRIRTRIGLTGYAAGQAALLFAIAVLPFAPPVPIALLMLFTIELVMLAGRQWGTIPITAGAIALYVVAQLFTSGMYRAMTAGLLLALSGALAHAIAALLRGQRVHDERSDVRSSTRRDNHADHINEVARPPVADTVTNLSPRELEVLGQVVKGSRTTDIAATLSISERTVKAHLSSIYQKLGVESRAAAVASAVRQGLV